jgi:hypothetical protein
MRRFSMLLLLLVTYSCVSFAQDPGTSDAQTWGQWQARNANAPYLQVRVRCDTDTLLNGRWQSNWDFQFKSGYKGPVDFVYLVQFGDPETHTNQMTGPFMETIGPGQISDTGGSELYGKCGQHATPTTGLHFVIKCAVPQGQDAPLALRTLTVLALG